MAQYDNKVIISYVLCEMTSVTVATIWKYHLSLCIWWSVTVNIWTSTSKIISSYILSQTTFLVASSIFIICIVLWVYMRHCWVSIVVCWWNNVRRTLLYKNSTFVIMSHLLKLDDCWTDAICSICNIKSRCVMFSVCYCNLI